MRDVLTMIAVTGSIVVAVLNPGPLRLPALIFAVVGIATLIRRRRV